MHALIIEDQALIAFTVEDHLRDLGFKTFAYAESRGAAVALAEVRRPDLVIADVELVDGPTAGVAAVEAICGDGGIPALFITGKSDQPALKGRPEAVVSKPFTGNHIKSTIRALMVDRGLADSILAPGTKVDRAAKASSDTA